jgi:hypothetical protein
MIHTSSLRRAIVVGGVIATALVPAVASARRPPGDDPPVPPTPPTTEAPPSTEPAPTPGPGPGPTVPPNPLRQPRYVLQAISFHAIDESGYDWLGSDEIFALFDEGSNLAVTSVFDDVDTGDTRQFGVTERCITPIAALVPGTDDGDHKWSGESGDQWRCAEQGRPGPIDVRVQLYEEDSPWQFWNWGCFFRGAGIPPLGCSDQRIGEQHLVFSEAELAAAMPTVGSTHTESVEFGGYCPGQAACTATGPWYSVTYRLTRFADYVAVNG